MPKHLTHKPWSHHWPAIIAGVFVVLGGVTMVLLGAELMIQPPAADATLTVTVVAAEGGVSTSTPVSLRTNSALEAISRVSNAAGKQTIYETHGGSSALVEAFGHTQGQGGTWKVFVAGKEVNDVTAATVQQGDIVRLQWTPAS